MKDWRPVIELECLLDALEAELLSATDDEISDALGRRQPTRMAGLAISDAIGTRDTIGGAHGAAGQEIASPSARNDVVRLS